MVWKIAVYIRLSKEDSRSFDESESVANQRAIIRDHIAGFDDGDQYIIEDEYIDDGVSGTTDDERGGFQRMLQDIRHRKINCVMVKDLARSFRNYSDQGYYLDDWFPRHNIRFISLYHQPLDSYRDPKTMRNIAVPIQGVINENHCAETSDKVREVFDLKRRNGDHIGSFAPYGYRKDPGNKNKLLPDPEAAQVVQDIFHMFLTGVSRNGIVRYLNDHGVPSPAAYKRLCQRLKYQNPRADPKRPSLWCAVSVGSILKNRMYCGDMVQGRYRRKSYKIHVQEAVPREQWYIVENTHPALIDRSSFEKAQQLLARSTRTAPGKNELYLFSGLLRCADCQKAMTRSKAGNIVYYYCRTYKDQSKMACTKHTLRHDRLEAAVLAAVRQQIYLAVDLQNAEMRTISEGFSKNRRQRYSGALEQKERELSKICRYKQAAYEDWKNGDISRSDYQYMKDDYDRQAAGLQTAVERLRAEQDSCLKEDGHENALWAEFRQSQNIDRLTRDLLVRLVDQIEVCEGGRISIRFRFADEFQRNNVSAPPVS